jgi:hypothetical protein
VTTQIHVETIPETESETASTQANQNTDECLSENGVFMEPTTAEITSERPDPPAKAIRDTNTTAPIPSQPPEKDMNPIDNTRTSTSARTKPDLKSPKSNPIGSRTTSWTAHLTKGIRQLEI